MAMALDESAEQQMSISVNVSGDRHHGDMSNPNLATGRVWRLHRGDLEVAQLAVTGAD
ncbi:hypothetical protein ACFV6D_25185 [Kitasatospora sp. NPDC059812]